MDPLPPSEKVIETILLYMYAWEGPVVPSGKVCGSLYIGIYNYI